MELAQSSLPQGGGEQCQHLPLAAPVSWAGSARARRMRSTSRAGARMQGQTDGWTQAGGGPEQPHPIPCCSSLAMLVVTPSSQGDS